MPDGPARIFSYHLMPWPGFEPTSHQQSCTDSGPFEGRSTNRATALRQTCELHEAGLVAAMRGQVVACELVR